MNDTDERDGDDDRRTFKWQYLAVVLAGMMVFLGFQLWRRLENVDPLRRCVGAYVNVHTAVDSSMVDRMRVRSNDGRGKITCGELRSRGALRNVPRQPSGGGLLPPRPQ